MKPSALNEIPQIRTSGHVEYRQYSPNKSTRVAAASSILLGWMIFIDPCNAAADSMVCKDNVFDTKPMYYAPRSIEDAKLSAMGLNPGNKSALGVEFELVGSPPCDNNDCKLLVFSGDKHTHIATIDLDRREFRFCRSFMVEQAVYENDKECSKPYLESYIQLHTDDNSPYIISRFIDIRYAYYISDNKINSASRCHSLEPPDGPLRAKVWRFREDNGAVFLITESDYLRNPKQPLVPPEVPFLVRPIPERLDE